MDHPDLANYCENVLALFAAVGCQHVETSVLRIAVPPTNARLKARLHYPHGILLSVNITVDVTIGAPSWPFYSFHLQAADGRCLFRYDNAPHHPHVRTYPFHKHVGEMVQESHIPSVHQVAGEILQYVMAATERGR